MLLKIENMIVPIPAINFMVVKVLKCVFIFVNHGLIRRALNSNFFW